MKREKCNSLDIKNIFINKCFIIYTDNCNIHISSNGQIIHLEEYNIYFFGRDVKMSATINKIRENDAPYKYLIINEDMLLKINNIIVSLFDHMATLLLSKDEKVSNIINIKANKHIKRLFLESARINDLVSKILVISYLLSISDKRNDIIKLLFFSSANVFSEKLRKIFEEDLSKNWRLNTVAAIFNISPITVRKRLESENTSFYRILNNARMNCAVRLLLQGEYQINQISRSVGFCSPSYFIKSFKKHFGITPKQFFLYFRGK